MELDLFFCSSHHSSLLLHPFSPSRGERLFGDGAGIFDEEQGVQEPSLWEEARKTSKGSPVRGGTACREASAVKWRSKPTPNEQQRSSTLKESTSKKIAPRCR